MALPHSLNPLDYPARFQFGQVGVSNALARTACTDTCVQMMIEFYKEKTITLNDIRHASGIGVDGLHGLTINGAIQALYAYGLTHYRTKIGVDATDILQAAYVGPVLFGIGYALYPSKPGATCGQGNLAKHGGREDCGFGGSHAVLALDNIAIKEGNTVVSYDAILRDPDHHTGYGPTYDRITGRQMTAAVNALKATGWSNTFMIYPTKKKTL